MPDQTKAQLEAEVTKLREQLKAASQPNRLSLKVSDNKKCLSIYGLQRRPVTLYAAQWERILAHSEAIATYIEDHRTELAWKE